MADAEKNARAEKAENERKAAEAEKARKAAEASAAATTTQIPGLMSLHRSVKSTNVPGLPSDSARSGATENDSAATGASAAAIPDIKVTRNAEEITKFREKVDSDLLNVRRPPLDALLTESNKIRFQKDNEDDYDTSKYYMQVRIEDVYNKYKKQNIDLITCELILLLILNTDLDVTEKFDILRNDKDFLVNVKSIFIKLLKTFDTYNKLNDTEITKMVIKQQISDIYNYVLCKNYDNYTTNSPAYTKTYNKTNPYKKLNNDILSFIKTYYDDDYMLLDLLLVLCKKYYTLPLTTSDLTENIFKDPEYKKFLNYIYDDFVDKIDQLQQDALAKLKSQPRDRTGAAASSGASSVPHPSGKNTVKKSPPKGAANAVNKGTKKNKLGEKPPDFLSNIADATPQSDDKRTEIFNNGRKGFYNNQVEHLLSDEINTKIKAILDKLPKTNKKNYPMYSYKIIILQDQKYPELIPFLQISEYLDNKSGGKFYSLFVNQIHETDNISIDSLKSISNKFDIIQYSECQEFDTYYIVGFGKDAPKNPKNDKQFDYDAILNPENNLLKKVQVCVVSIANTIGKKKRNNPPHGASAYGASGASGAHVPQQPYGYPPQPYGYTPQPYGYPPQPYGYTPQPYGYTPQQYGYTPQQYGYPPQPYGFPTHHEGQGDGGRGGRGGRGDRGGRGGHGDGGHGD